MGRRPKPGRPEPLGEVERRTPDLAPPYRVPSDLTKPVRIVRRTVAMGAQPVLHIPDFLRWDDREPIVALCNRQLPRDIWGLYGGEVLRSTGEPTHVCRQCSEEEASRKRHVYPYVHPRLRTI